MAFILFFGILIVLYVKSFKESFNEEQVQKVAPVLIITIIVLFILAILASIISN